MRSSGIRFASLVALAMMTGVAGIGVGQVVHVGDPAQNATTPSAKQQPAERGGAKVVNPLAASLNYGGESTTRRRRRAGYGWTNKRAQRVATKKRNVRKFRAANR